VLKTGRAALYLACLLSLVAHGALVLHPEWVRAGAAPTSTPPAAGRAAQLMGLQPWGGLATVVVFSPDGRQIAAGDEGGQVRLWDALDGALLRGYGEPGAAIRSLAFSPDARLVAAGDDAGGVALWRAATGGELRRVRMADADAVAALAFDRSATHVTAAGVHGAVRTWDVATGRLTGSVDLGTAPLATALSPAARQVAVAVLRPLADPTFATHGDSQLLLGQLP